MRRHVLHIAAALLAFLVGFLTADSYQNLAYALPLSLLTFFIVKVLPRCEIDVHFLIVVVMSLSLWAAGVSAFLSIISTASGSCVLEFTDEGSDTTIDLSGDALSLSTDKTPSEIPNYSYADVSSPVNNSVWGGVLDRKAITKPKPYYPPIAKAARAEGTVAVWVLVDESGSVVWSQAISGHPLLQQPAINAAYLARFSPISVDGSPIRVSGVLTYRFKF